MRHATFQHGVPRGSRGSAIPATLTFFLGLALGAVAVAAGGGGLSALGVAGGGSGHSASIIEAARLEGDIYRLMMAADDAARGSFDAYDELAEMRQAMSRRIATLRNGDEALGVRRAGEKQADLIDLVERSWRRVDDSAQRILLRKELILDVVDSAQSFGSMAPQMQARLDEVARLLIEAEAPAQQQYLVMRNLVLVDRLLRGTREILAGGHGAVISADRFARDTQMLGRSIDGLLNGNQELGIGKIENEKAHAVLREVSAIFSDLEADADSILAASTEIFEVHEAASMIRDDGNAFASDALALAQSY